ncbi:hypothetical protein TNCV_1841481 [Trichonephila clavipes]|nr:hypothetical protein TNCV_1841481 [Trichonephila clavipes]
MLVRVLTKTLRPLDCKFGLLRDGAIRTKMEATTTNEAEGYIKTLVEVLSRRMAFATKNRYNYGLNIVLGVEYSETRSQRISIQQKKACLLNLIFVCL